MTNEDVIRWRKAVGWSQAMLAAKLGVTNVDVCRWERGKRPMRRVVILAIKAVMWGVEDAEYDALKDEILAPFPQARTKRRYIGAERGESASDGPNGAV